MKQYMRQILKLALGFLVMSSALTFVLFSIGKLRVNTEHSELLDRSYSNALRARTLFLITPTVNRYGQLAHITRLANTLRQVENLHWIVIEDGNATNPNVEAQLNRSKTKYTYLFAETNRTTLLKGRGVEQRNLAIDYIRSLKPKDGLVYFADDDNSFDLELFDVLRRTKYCGVIPVGLLAQLPFEDIDVVDDKVVGFFTIFGFDRKYQIDMAGFVVHVSAFYKDPVPKFYRTVMGGRLESDFLAQVVNDPSELEPIARDYDRVLAWHTKSENREAWTVDRIKSLYPDKWKRARKLIV
ncbi:galactosyl-galactosyl-xylosyl protein 3-beta-glucuronosyltransferase [Acrasis kona]|uniref:Galactosyl-galactosyl-xylosyl protein 3-beta-glucuronosyltransferase n=1 Tax=Acrasis kona TaxID=1008807 RepID=A0AAW2Z213_9EUKA